MIKQVSNINFVVILGLYERFYTIAIILIYMRKKQKGTIKTSWFCKSGIMIKLCKLKHLILLINI